MSASDDQAQERAAELRRAALEYHEFPTPGKLQVVATKQMIKIGRASCRERV